jgi:hypothetical protein
MPRSAFDEIREDEYTEALEAREIGEKLIETNDRHAHLQDALVGYLFRDDEVSGGIGKVVDASAHLVAQLIGGSGAKYFGRFAKWALQKELGFLPDFLILVDKNRWEGFDEREKRRLINHELSHCVQKEDENGTPKFNQTTGAPSWGIKPHDFEEFCGVIEDEGLVTEESRQMAGVMVNAAIKDADDLSSAQH